MNLKTVDLQSLVDGILRDEAKRRAENHASTQTSKQDSLRDAFNTLIDDAYITAEALASGEMVRVPLGRVVDVDGNEVKITVFDVFGHPGLAEYARALGEKYGVIVALDTDYEDNMLVLRVCKKEAEARRKSIASSVSNFLDRFNIGF